VQFGPSLEPQPENAVVIKYSKPKWHLVAVIMKSWRRRGVMQGIIVACLLQTKIVRPLRPEVMASIRASTRLQREISHAALWLLICFAGGSIAIVLFDLAVKGQLLDQLLVSICDVHVR
jgi:hypothetical protein